MKPSNIIKRLKMLIAIFNSKKSFVDTLNYLEDDFKKGATRKAKPRVGKIKHF